MTTTATNSESKMVVLSDEPQLSSAALCMKLRLFFGPLGDDTKEDQSHSSFVFGPVFTHQCFPGEWITGYQPFQAVLDGSTERQIKHMKVAIIGGGAAGFFAAIHVKENFPEAEVTIFEKSKKYLAKVKISGGGRCNVTNAATSISELSKAYPRGEKFLKKAFHQFDNKDMMRWLEERGVPLVIQEDNCVFPRSQNSQSIIDCFVSEAERLGVEMFLERRVSQVQAIDEKISLQFNGGEFVESFEKVIVATGGSPKRSGLTWLEELGLKVSDPLPSLYTFNMPTESVRDLMGIVVENVLVKVQSSKLRSEGPLLITHWGMSGPAILKLSAFGARLLAERNYDFSIHVNWVNEANHEKIKAELSDIALRNSNRQLSNYRPYGLPNRLWIYLLEKGDLSLQRKWNELGAKGINTLVRLLAEDIYKVDGKTTFKEEFVTCGGVSLDEINVKSMESKKIKNLFFCGEIMDIDGITGGYNFQAAWTSAFIAAKLGV